MPIYRRSDIPRKLTDFHETLERSLKADALRPKPHRWIAQALFAQIKAEGYDSGYSPLTAFVRDGRGKEGRAVHAFVPLKFELGEAFPFDGSEEGWGHLPAHAGLTPQTMRQSGVLAGRLFCPWLMPTRAHSLRWAAFPAAASTTT